MLNSAEANCFPENTPACGNNATWYAENRPSDTSYRFVNGGCWMGPADLVPAIIDSWVNWENPTWDDQWAWQVREAGCGTAPWCHCSAGRRQRAQSC